MQKKGWIILAMGWLLSQQAAGQMITGVWQGKMNRQKVELKIIQKGDSLTGTAYYYQSPGRFTRFSIKGYFDDINQAAVWWDDELLEEQGRRAAPGGEGTEALLLRADFNCPDGSIMQLLGEATPKDDETRKSGEVHLAKVNHPVFSDEWDFVIDHFTAGANDPGIIDSVEQIAKRPPGIIPEAPVAARPPVARAPETGAPETIAKTIAPVIANLPLTIEEKFVKRHKIAVLEIPVSGDSIELNFYDNAEIDGDSISLFLNDRLIFQHIYLTDKPFSVKLPVGDLLQNNELVMVAENLGSIPPNTSFMVAHVGGKRYEARLESNEGSSAMIRFKKE